MAESQWAVWSGDIMASVFSLWKAWWARPSGRSISPTAAALLSPPSMWPPRTLDLTPVWPLWPRWATTSTATSPSPCTITDTQVNLATGAVVTVSRQRFYTTLARRRGSDVLSCCFCLPQLWSSSPTGWACRGCRGSSQPCRCTSTGGVGARARGAANTPSTGWVQMQRCVWTRLTSWRRFNRSHFPLTHTHAENGSLKWSKELMQTSVQSLSFSLERKRSIAAVIKRSVEIKRGGKVISQPAGGSTHTILQRGRGRPESGDLSPWNLFQPMTLWKKWKRKQPLSRIALSRLQKRHVITPKSSAGAPITYICSDMLCFTGISSSLVSWWCSSPLQLHVVHYNSELYPNMAAAMTQRDGLAVLATLIVVRKDAGGKIKLAITQLLYVSYWI